MASWTTTQQLTLTEISCGACWIVFAVPEDWRQNRKLDGETFYCPNGHPRVFRETEADRLRKELQQAQRQRDLARANATHEADQRLAAERSAAAYKGQTTRLRKRVGKGVCPCCNRHFENVGRHMASKHPEFAEADS